MKTVAIIPARYASTRLPGKPLAMIGNKPMIQHVFENVLNSGLFEQVYVATDDKRIAEAVAAFDGNVIMTSPNHQTGTDRCGEALSKISDDFEIMVNIQGDEPFLARHSLSILLKMFADKKVDIATLVKEIKEPEDLFNPSIIKVTRTLEGRALYFSRHQIPFVRDKNIKLTGRVFWKHIGLYGFRTETLRKVIKLPQTPLEQAESLEQLRWLEHGFKIHTGETYYESLSVDTPEDLVKASILYKEKLEKEQLINNQN